MHMKTSDEPVNLPTREEYRQARALIRTLPDRMQRHLMKFCRKDMDGSCWCGIHIDADYERRHEIR
jgi:hypothetical protein